MGTVVCLLNDVWVLDWGDLVTGDLVTWGWIDSCGSKSSGTIFTRVLWLCHLSFGTSARAGGHSISMWPLHVAWASLKYGGVRVVGLFIIVQGSKVECPKRTKWKLYDLSWLILRSHIASLLLHSVGYKWVTKYWPDSIEEGIQPISWWEEYQIICGSVLKTKQFALWPQILNIHPTYKIHWPIGLIPL